jgi:hypothetical protein
MLKIGMDKTDRDFRKFEYDDERKYGNPLVYKVLYEETGTFGEVMCSNVITIKKSNNVHNHFLDIPIYKNVKEEVTPQPVAVSEPLVVSVDPVEPSATTEEKKKDKSTKSKAKTKDVPLKGKAAEVKEVSLELKPDVFIPKSYEYDILIIDVADVKEIKDKLNEMGHHGWEVCGFQTVQKMFGCQAMFIMKKGLK